MDWKLFASTFALIFLAELGDKTQLAAMAATAGTRSPVSIFAGASTALVLSTLIAVTCGATIQRLVPLNYLKIAAGILFLVFGGLLLASVWHTRPGEAAAVQPAKAGVLARIAMAMAADFEEATTADYRRLASSVEDPRLGDLLRLLADEERGHLERMRGLAAQHASAVLDSRGLEAPHGPVALCGEGIDAQDLLASAQRHELAAAAFYEELARSTPVHSLQRAFGELSNSERDHARRLESFGRYGET